MIPRRRRDGAREYEKQSKHDKRRRRTATGGSAMRGFAALAAAALFASAAPAQDWAKAKLEKSSRHQEWVKVKHGNREVNSFVVYPEVKDKATTVVVIHEIFGLTAWGGGQSFRYATNNKALKAAYVFYGGGPDSDADVARIACPVYGFYAGNDARVNMTVPKSAELMKKAAKTFEPVTYEGAGHGFMRAGEDPKGTPENKK